MSEPLKFTEQFRRVIGTIRTLRQEVEAVATLMFPEVSVDWARLRKLFEDDKVIVASIKADILTDATTHGFLAVRLHFEGGASIYDKLSHGVLEALADDLIPRNSRVLALYSAMDSSRLDSISVINLGEHLERLSGRNLRELEDRVPLKTLKTVVDLATEIGAEGREGKMIGTLFVVGDTRKVMTQSRYLGFDPVKGYPRSERCLFNPEVREGIKEVAQLDGAFVVTKDGIVEAACRSLESPHTSAISLSMGLGTRHWAAATISRTTAAIAVVVSQSSGTVRIFKDGEVTLRIEARQRLPLVWRDFESD